VRERVQSEREYSEREGEMLIVKSY